MYDEEDWLPDKETTDGDDGDEESVGNQRHRVSQSVLKDLGNKYSGDEMDLIAKTAEHGYYLRSLEQAGSYPSGGGSSSDAGQTALSLPVHAAVTVCPYDIPEPHLPAPPTPRGNTASDYYEALNARDQEIRKGL